MAVKHMKENIEKLESTAKEEDKESDKSMLLQEVNQYNGELTTNFAELRKANFTSQMLINKKNQEILFGSNETELKKRKKNGKGGVIKLSSGITDSLQSLSQTMAAQVAQSEQAMQTLVGTSTTIEETHQEFHGMAGVIYQSRKLLSKYNRREITDKVVIFLAIAFFFACVLYVITKRVF